MNPMTNIKNLQKLNERELELGIIGKKSWHDEYKASAWIFVGGLPYDLTEGDIICVFSQYGEIVNINLVRDGKTGKSKGYAFICFQDQRSTVLSVDNLNSIKILGRTIRVDHVKDYKMPKGRGDEDEMTLKLQQEGCAPKIESSPEEMDNTEEETKPKKKKEKKKKAKKEKKKKRKEKGSSEEEDGDSSSASDKQEIHDVDIKKEKLHIKEEKMDSGFDNALRGSSAWAQSSSRHNSADEDVWKKKRSGDYDRQSDSMRNGVKKEMWNDGGRDRSGAGRDTGFRDNSDSQRYDRNKGSDYRRNNREYDRGDRGRRDDQYEGSRDHKDRHSYREGRDRHNQRKDDFTRGEYSHQESDDDYVDDAVRSRHGASDRNVDGHKRRRGSRSRSRSNDNNHSKKRKHRSRSRSRER